MKKSYIFIITLLIGIAFAACKKNQGNDFLLDNHPPNAESENAKDIGESEAVDDGDYNTDKTNTIGSINNIEESLDVEIANVDENEDIISESESIMYYYVIGNVVRLRENASLESNTINLLSLGTRVKYMEKKGDWIKVKYDNEIGYIRNDLLSETEPIEDMGDMEDIEGMEDIAETPLEPTVNSIDGIDNPKIVVMKADRILQLWDGDTLKASYPIGLGWEPVGDKEKEGDGKTPEGTYYVCTRNNFSRFYLSLGLSYPNIEDANEGLEAGLIDLSTYNQIEDAIDRGVQPPWNTALGGEIMIHGHGSQSDWTAGCIAVDNDIMDILWEHCRIGTRVIIEP
ncbi:MAG: hypothetical protein EWM47_13270 [Anaerolineaceae bacterium]|nr:MAG: hypothetical protein EWM47_13270 [Anaerolineaceae bacterium]